MDSFEASSQFGKMLRALVPQMQVLLKTAHFALRNSDSEDYLFYAIMDVLKDPKVELNFKSTVFQLIDVLIHESFYVSQQVNSNYNYPYVHNLKSSLPKIMIKVLPATSSANLHNIHNNLRNISDSLNVNYSEFDKQFASLSELLSPEELENIDMNLPYPDIDDVVDDTQDPVIQAWAILLHKRKQSHYDRVRLLKHGGYKDADVSEEDMFNIRPSRAGDPARKVNEQLLSKKQILLRMEDDRETHKKSKETLWQVNRPTGSTAVTEEEFLKHYWSKLNGISHELNSEFITAFDELNKLAAASYKDNQF